MRKIPTIIFFLFISVVSWAQIPQYVERLDSIVSDNGEITRFTYDEQFRIVAKNTSMGDKLVRKEVSEYAEDGTLASYCAYEEREGRFVPVRKKDRKVKDGGRCVEINDSVYVEDIKKMSPKICEVLTYDENGNLISRSIKEYDLQSDGKSYKQLDINYDAEENKIYETIISPEYKFTREYKDGKIYVITRYDNQEGQWVMQESTVREYYESGALQNEYSYDYSGIIFYMNNFTVYDENGEKVKSQDTQQSFSYKYIRDEKGRVKEVQKYLTGSENLVDREEYHYDQLPIDSAYYTLCYASEEIAPYAKYYYIPNQIVDGKVDGGFSKYEKFSADGPWVSLTTDATSLSHSYADKTILAQYEVGDETVTLYDYTVVTPTDYGKLVRKEDKRSMDKSLPIVSEEEIYYDKSLSGSLIAGFEEDYKVTQVINRDAKGNEVKGTYFYTSLMTTSMTGISLMSSGKSAVYNLNGQRLTCPQKGINIIGGKKIAVTPLYRP